LKNLVGRTPSEILQRLTEPELLCGKQTPRLSFQVPRYTSLTAITELPPQSKLD